MEALGIIHGTIKVTGSIILLYQDYDPDQYWLPFINAVHLSDKPFDMDEELEKKKQEDREQRKQKRKLKKTKIRDVSKTVVRKDGFAIHYETYQGNLPFVEAIELPSDLVDFENSLLKETGWPCWGYRHKPFRFDFYTEEPDQVLPWCREHCEGRYRVLVWGNPHTGEKHVDLLLQRPKDAMLAKLTFGDIKEI